MGFQARSSARSSEFFSYVVKIAFLCIHFIEHGSKAGFFEGKKDLISFYPESQEHRTVQENSDSPEFETWRNFVVLRARPFHVIIISSSEVSFRIMVELSLFMHRDCDIRNLFWRHQIKKVFSEKFHQSLLISGGILHD